MNSHTVNKLKNGNYAIQAETPIASYKLVVDQLGVLRSYQIEISNSSNPQSSKLIKITPCALLKTAIHKLTGEKPCGQCVERCKQMDEWGWWRCWKERRTIARWMKEAAQDRADKKEQAAQKAAEDAKKARESADAIDESEALTMLRAAWREMRR